MLKGQQWKQQDYVWYLTNVQRHIYNPVENFSFFLVTIFAKTLHLRCSTGFQILTSLNLTIKKPWQHQASHSYAFIVDFEGRFSKIEITYVNYCNIAWASTSRTTLGKILKKQKHPLRIIYNEDICTHSKPLMRDMTALNVYQINIFQVLKFMYKSKHNLNPRVSDNTFKEIHHGYPRRSSRSNFKQPKIITKTTSFAISSCGPTWIWKKKNYLCLYFFIN